VYIAQFVKGMKYSEMNSLAKPEDVEIVITGRAADSRIIEAAEMTCGEFEKIKKRYAKL
jgi:ATP:corrinoid adenosyltransferase